jgi:hypothetical protein
MRRAIIALFLMRQPRANRKLLGSPGLPFIREFADKCRHLARFAQTLFHWQNGETVFDAE